MHDLWRFSETAIAEWARFSNDFNPLHFDREFARTAGFPSLIVHGNLVGLKLKLAMDSLAHASSCMLHKPWWSFTARLRLAVPVNRATRLLSQSRGEVILYQLALEPEQQTAVTGWLKGAYGPVNALPKSSEHTEMRFTAEEVASRLDMLLNAFPVDAGWVQVDAVLNSLLLDRVLGPAVREHGLPAARGWDAMAGKVVLQATEEVGFATQIFNQNFTPRALRVLVAPSCSTTWGDHTVVTCRWWIVHNSVTPIMEKLVRIAIRPLATHTAIP